ncbi:hypothetical protein BTO06_13795 [Tenacibaculum sp. SZ-18]|uniref:TlpA family protein disulfide reductase n=1 Tax=Tenacibaculum sp. SZ-18 TaxID=754423 RepID=UPI000C2D1016|nr:redoxin domain-containing protein [Tenacibaculum sp. SZ-18]AUC16167.1 hypothetical protein BTO06_13795 [Tenacibaculum sp. SZ-18]
MKNILITIVTMAVAFGISFYVLTNFYKHDNELDLEIEGTSNLYVNSSTDDTTLDTDADFTDNDTETSYNESDLVTDTNSVNTDMFPDTEAIFADLTQWKTYFNRNVNLSSNFVPLNNQGEEIDKGDFLSDLTSGSFAPIKLLSGTEMYQLYDIENIQNQKISASVIEAADLAYAYFVKEGTKLPEFNFSDINGSNFSNSSTSEKIIILTCWKIDSKKSISEFSRLNKLYDKYEAYEDVIFLSISSDKSSKLLQFLTKKEFRYPVVADQESYMKDQIEVRQYPTHLIIDEDGNIEKMVSSVSQLEAALEKIAEPDLTDLEEEEGM